jgi:uncharacterized protein with HEPN domain
MSEQSIKLYIHDILDSIQAIFDFTKDMTYGDFLDDRRTIDAVVRNLEIIGEAAKYIPQDVRDQYINIPWKKMINMRNHVIHEYSGIDPLILWGTIQEDLPGVQKNVEQLWSSL